MARLYLDPLKLLLLFFLFSAGSSPLFGQISPGPLSRPHEGLEGVTNCTKCHDRGAEIATSKCLDCHKEISHLITARHGMHSRTANQACNECHKEHLGRDAAITRFDPASFDHRETGFALSGKHGTLTCARCHEQQKFRVEKNAMRKDGSGKSFLGLQASCVSCHNDRHGATVSNECQQCHTTSAWTPLGGFDHSKASFALSGKHQTVDCAKCHAALASTPRPGVILFKVTAFSDCTPCHRSPHAPAFTRNRLCRDCHSTEGWKSTDNFNHAATRFPLIGKHASVSCEKCHTGMNNRKPGIPTDFSTKPFADCRSCHKSPHNEALNKNTCTSCHTPVSWQSVRNSSFDHGQTNFPLRAKHISVACESCHQSGRASSLAVRFHDAPLCLTCHQDYHRGAFGKRYKDCADCHTESGFTPSTYSLAAHSKLKFPLTGSHGAVLCRECHVKKEGTTRFVFESLQCASCHNDFHKGAFQRFMGSEGCVTCHSPAAWSTVRFDHSRTGFALEGKHQSINCNACHKKERNTVRYKGLPQACSSCHPDPHRNQFAVKGSTRCESCHTPRSWRLLIFDHEKQSTFRLSGAHIKVPCGACHKPEKTAKGSFVRFKPLPQTCEACHKGKKKL